MRAFSRLGLFSAAGLLGLAVFRMAGRQHHRSSRRRGLPFMRLLPEDGFGGPGVFERTMTFPPVEVHASPNQVEEVALPAPRRASTRVPAKKSAKQAAKKPAAKKSAKQAAKKPAAKKSAKQAAKKPAAKKVAAERRPAR